MKQRAENRNTRSWQASIDEAIERITATHKRRKVEYNQKPFVELSASSDFHGFCELGRSVQLHSKQL